MDLDSFQVGKMCRFLMKINSHSHGSQKAELYRKTKTTTSKKEKIVIVVVVPNCHFFAITPLFINRF